MAEYQYINGVRVPIQNQQKSELELLNTNKNSIDNIGFVSDHKIDAVQNALGTTFINGINTGYSVSDEDAKLAKKYDITVGKFDNRYSLERKIADVQNGWEQFGKSVSQIAINEVFLGTLLGFSDLYDWLANLGKAYGEDDWNNAFGKVLTDAQDKLKEDWKIYRENPNKTFDIHDAGWWWDNFVTVGSTASLLIPSLTITKGLSYAGKGTKYLSKIIKLDRELHKAGRWLGKTAPKLGIENPYTISNALEKFTNSAVPAVISRQMEDMLEGRETYKQVFENTMQQFATMTDKEREEFYQRNQDIIFDKNGNLKSDEDIAKYIADKAATYTFVNDFKYIGFDFLQFNSILRFGKRPITRGTSKSLNRLLDRLAHNSERAAENIIERSGRKGALKEALNFYAKNPRIAIKQAVAHSEFTEGLEEIGQGITQENALGEYEKFFNPNYSNRTLASQLSDPQLWEQGFWGMLGGMIFQSAGRGIKKGGKYLYKKVNADKLSQQDIEKLEANEETLREKQIDSGINSIETLKNKLELWKQGYNPQVKRINSETGEEIQNDYTSTDGFKLMTEDEKGMVLEDIINEFLLNMTAGAVEVGNGDLLEAFIEDERFKKYISELNADDSVTKDLYDKITQKYKAVKELYYNNLNKVFGSIDIDSEYLGKALALNMTRNTLFIDNINKEIKRIDDTINKHNEDKDLIDLYHSANLARETGNAVRELLDQTREVQTKYDNGEINFTFAKSQLVEIYKAVDKLLSNPGLSEVLTESLPQLDEESNIISEKVITQWLNHYAEIRPKYQEWKNNKDITIKNIEDLINEFDDMLNQSSDRLKDREKEIGTPTNEVKELINDKIQQELQLAIKQSQELNGQEEIQEAYDDYYAAATDIANNRLLSYRKDIIDYIENSENPEQAFENLMNDTAPEKIQEAFNYFKVGDENYAYHVATFKLAANIKEKKKQMAVPKTDNQKSDNATLETDEEIKNASAKQQSPSTGVQIESENNIPEEVNEPDEDDIAVQEIIENNGLEEIPIEVNEVEYSDEDIKREGFIRSIVPTKLKDASNETRIGIRENGIEGEEFKDFIKSCVDDLKQNPIFENISEQDLTRTIEQEFANTLELISPNSSINIQNVYNKLIDDIRNKKYSAETRLITNSDIENEVDKIIDDYLKDYENKDIPIDLRDFFDYIVENYQGNLVNILNPIIYRFTQDINSDVHKYKINEKTSYLIQKYKESPTKFLQELLSRKTKNSLISDELPSFHSQMPANAYNGFKYIQLRNIKGEKEATEEIFGKRNIKIVDNGINRTEINETEIRRDEAIQAYVDWFTTIQNYKENPEAKLIVYQVGAAFNIRLYDGSVSLLDLQKAEHLNKTIAFLARVEPILTDGKNNNNAFAKIVTKNSYGLRYKVYKSDNGTITTNFDDLYNKIINDDVIYNMILNEQTNFSKDELKQLYDYFKDYINVKKDEDAADIILKDYNGKSLSENNAKDLLRYLHEIFGNYRQRGGNRKSAQKSFDEFKEKLYSNYSLTYALDSRFEENKKNHKYTVLDLRELPITEEIITQVKNPYPINKEKFDIKTAKLVYVDNDYRIHIGNSDKSFDNPFNIHANNIGIILKEYDDGRLPLIALSMGGNLIKDTNPLYSPLRNTISYLVKQCYDANKSGNSIKTLVEQLKELIGKDSVFYRKPSDGYKSFAEEVVKLVYKQKNYSEELVDKLMNGITFNPSVALAKGKLNSTNNFINIDNGKLTITLPNEKGDISFNYDSYAQFCIENEAFNINQDLTVDPNVPNSILFDSSIKELYSTPSPVKGGKVLKQISALKDTLNELGKNDKIETKRVLKIAGFTEKDVATLLGENSNISFIDSTIKFDKDSQDNDFAYYDKRSSDIYLTNRIFNEDNIPTEINAFKYNIARLIIHENVHKNFDKLSKDDKKIVINHLKDIFLDFADYYITDIDTSADNKFAKSIAKGFENTRWSLDNIKDLKKLIEENKISEDELIDNMNEFFAETLSQPYLIKYLDSKEYRRERINVEDSNTPKDTIWTKIVKLIVEFFNKIESNFFENLSINNLDNSEKISIFAEEYKLLSILGGDKIVTKKESTIIAKDNVEKGKQLSIQFNEEPTTEEIDNLIDEELEDTAIRKAKYIKKKISAQTPMITSFEVRSKINDDNGNFDSSGISRVPSMTDFVKSHKYTEQAVISSLLKSGAFEYACK